MKKIFDSEWGWLIKLILIAVLAVILFFLIRKLIVWFKKQEAENKLQNAIATGTTTGGTTFSTNYGSVAQRIYNAFYDNDWFGFSEDEEAAIIAINDVPKEFIPQLKQTYFDLYDKNLEADCIKYLGDEYSRVQNKFN